MARQPSDNRRQPVAPVLEADPQMVAPEGGQPPLRSRPANENDPSTAQVIGRLRRRPSYDVIWVSLILSVVWALGCLWIYKDIFSSAQNVSQTQILQAIALLVLPIFGMTTIAYFLWRAQQLRQVSEVLMHQAMRLIRPQDLAADGLSSIAQAVRQEVDLLVGGVEHAVQRASALEEIVHKEIAAVERAFGSNEDRIRNLVHGLENQRAALQQTSTMVASDAQPMLQRLESNTHNLNEVVNLALSTFGRLEDGLRGSTTELARTIETVSQRAAETGSEIGNHAQQFERMSTMLVSDFRGFAGQLQDNIQNLNFTASNLGAETRKFGTEVRDMEQNLIGLLNQSAGRITDSHTTLAAAVAQAVGQVDASSVNLLTGLGQSSNEIQDKLQWIGTNINNLLVSTSGTIAAHLKDTSEIVSRQMQDSGLALAQTIETTGGAVTDRLLSVSGDFVQKVEGTQNHLISTFIEVTGDLTTRMEETSTQVYGRLRETSETLLGSLNVISGDINGKMDETAQTISTKLDQSSATLGSLLTSTETRLGNHMDQATIELEALFNENTRMLTEQLDQSSEMITKSFAERALETTETLNAAAVAATTRVDDASKAMFTRLNGSAAELGKRFDDARDHLEQVTLDISQRMDGQSRRFVQVLDDASSEIFADLGKARDAFAEGLGETTLQISGRFEQETGLLVGRIDTAISEFTNSANTSSSKLDEAAEKFAHHVSTTNSLLAGQLASAAADIDTRLENVAAQLTGKLEIASSRISERLDDVSSLVEKSIDKFNTEIEQTLHSRRDMLDSLVNDANRRAADVDKAMSDYLSLIDSNMETAEQRAKHISQIVSDQSAAALARLEEELQRLESSSSSQVVQAARALREQQERALTSMNEMLASTAADFQQTAQDMRITAQQVVKDIDTARDELKRAVIDLPEETRNNADNMRRVVADQISALNALADVVRKQSVSIDYSSPGFISSRTGTSGQTKTEAISTPSRSSSLRSEGPRLSERKANTLAKDIEGYTTKLNVAARDVVESIEGQLPRDLERRYAADKSVYTTRLFESRSRKMIKQLEERFGEDRLLRSRIQAYNRLFEKLLDTVSEADGSDAMMEEVLASEQGRVYVMLAEAAGRLPSQS